MISSFLSQKVESLDDKNEMKDVSKL